MDSIGPKEAMPKLPNARAAFRHELQLLELPDIGTWLRQAFRSTSVRGRASATLPHTSVIGDPMLCKVYCARDLCIPRTKLIDVLVSPAKRPM